MGENKYTAEDLKMMQAWSLERKIRVTQTRIIEWYQHWDGQVYVSFSGGKDSTVLLDLVRRIYPDVPGVFCDTGLEFPEIRDFVKTFENVIWLKPAMRFDDVIKKYGYPIINKEQAERLRIFRTTKSQHTKDVLLNGRIYSGGQVYGKISEKWKALIDAPFLIDSRCCDVMKKRPSKKYEKETGRKVILGSMAQEAKARKDSWIQKGCNAFDEKRPRSSPLSFWTEDDILQYLLLTSIPYASKIYGEIIKDDNGILKTTGETRTGCVFCAFGAHMEKEPNRFQRLKLLHPKIHEYCMKPVEEGGLGMAAVLDYINVPHE